MAQIQPSAPPTSVEIADFSAKKTRGNWVAWDNDQVIKHIFLSLNLVKGIGGKLF